MKLTPYRTETTQAGELAEYHLTTAQAVAIVKRQPNGTRFMLRSSRDAPIEGLRPSVFTGAICVSAHISKATAVSIAMTGLPPKVEAAGGQMPITTYIAARHRALYLL